MTIIELSNIKNQEVAQKLTKAWQIIEQGDYGSGETINHIPANVMTVENFLDHLITWYTLSDLSYKTVHSIATNGFERDEYTESFSLIFECYNITNSKSPEDLISFLETNY